MKSFPMKFPACMIVAVALAAAGCQPGAPASEATASGSVAASSPVAIGDLVARGDYLVRTTGCNDCHTPGYAEQQGNVARSLWLTGSPMGYKGPWGTTYATNLRMRLDGMDERQWLDFSSTLKTRPIMPDFAVRAMTVEDRRAIYHFVKSLGPGGGPAPAFVPPDQTPAPPYFELVLPAAAAPAAPTRG